ncbi:hypothetical protein GPECTOR_12g460 [Gonium pectorale]|uniref:Uncharacterized protein n=1 Tax=Gonium pectorale TaxID=33097 RepID=A0A150GNV0_GONPE|nr:hypothetical protein GPECTOR_12g460 [Gonium pectorale]|eukprot:KXZ51497.1 hypothetical protein GPECTOR_12g460 [Gonium pectorale]
MRGLGGATRKEKTRDELLEAVRAERAARGETRLRARAALTIQRTWRGHAARRRLRAALAAEWAATYGSMVAAPEARLGAEEVAGKLLPPFLFLLKPPRIGGTAPAAAPGAPAAAAASPRPHAAPAAPPPLQLPPPGSPLSVLVRGCLALLLRSASAADPRDSYLALAAAADEGRRVRRWGGG